MSATTIRDVVIAVSVKNSGDKLAPPDLSPWYAALNDFEKAKNRVFNTPSSVSKPSFVSAGGGAAGAGGGGGSPDSDKYELAKIAYAKEATKAWNAEAAKRLGISKRLAQDELKLLKDQEAESAGVAKANAQAFLKAKQEQEEEYAGVAKAYEQDELRKINMANAAAAAQVDANARIRGAYASAADGAFMLIRGAALAKAATTGNLESAVRNFAAIQGAIDATKGAIATVSGLVETYKGLRAAQEAATAATAASTAATTAAGAASSGAASKVGLLAGSFNPVVAGAAALVGAAQLWKLHAMGIVESTKMQEVAITDLNQVETIYARERAKRIADWGRSPLVSTAIDAASSVVGFVNPKAGANLKNVLRDETKGDPEEGEKVFGADEANMKLRNDMAIKIKASDYSILANQKKDGAEMIRNQSWNANTLLANQIAASQKVQAFRDSTRSSPKGYDPESTRMQESFMTQRTEVASQQFEMLNRGFEVETKLDNLEKERVAIQEQMKNTLPGDEGKTERLEIEKKLGDLAQKRVEILNTEGDALRGNLRSRLDSINAAKDLLRTEEDRQKSIQERFGQLNPGEQAQAKRLAAQAEAGGPMHQFDLKKLDELLGPTPFTKKQFQEKGKEAGGEEVFARLGVKTNVGEARKHVEDLENAGGGLDEIGRKVQQNQLNISNAVKEVARIFETLVKGNEEIIALPIKMRELSRRIDRMGGAMMHPP